MYRNLVTLSNRYVMVCEYYNPTPMAVSYRGAEDRLFKRDFAGELMDQYHLEVVDYGFCYHRDNYLAQGLFHLVPAGEMIAPHRSSTPENA